MVLLILGLDEWNKFLSLFVDLPVRLYVKQLRSDFSFACVTIVISIINFQTCSLSWTSFIHSLIWKSFNTLSLSASIMYFPFRTKVSLAFVVFHNSMRWHISSILVRLLRISNFIIVNYLHLFPYFHFRWQMNWIVNSMATNWI